MPIFLVPLHESNDCHNPGGSPAGGEFCSDLTGAQRVRPGRPFDLVAAAAARASGETATRRFLFNPDSRETILGVAYGMAGRDQNHAEAHAKADPPQPGEAPTAAALRYDRYRVHGHIQMKPGTPLALVIDRVVAEDTTTGGFRKEAREVEVSDLLYRMAARFVTMGATKTTPILSRDLGGSYAKTWTTLGKAFPDLFKTRRRAA
jgi:hypothetical protein